MTELACQADPRFIASRLEEGEGKSYSVDTVERVRATRPSSPISSSARTRLRKSPAGTAGRICCG